MAGLSEYHSKRRFDKTPEPRGTIHKKDERIFVIQKHAATRLHYDLRFELGGVLKSWAVPKGPSLNPADKRLAVHVEDHPFDYRTFEGTIPAGHYGAGEVIVWDQGTYEPEGTASTEEQLRRGDFKFRLHGQKLNGSFVLVRIRRSEKQNEWLLIKHRDEFADPNWKIEEHPESVRSDRSLGTVNRTQIFKEREPITPSKIPDAKPAPMPEHISVTLATLAEKPFSNPNWLFEIKWDGVRALAFVDHGTVRLMARSGRDVSAEYPEFQNLAQKLKAETAILDGEIVTLDENGHSSFQKLQNRIGVTNPPARLRESIPLTYYAYDLLYCNGFDLRKSPLLQRKELLRQILRADEDVRYSEHQLEKGQELFEAAKAQGLEGIVGKQIESIYTGNRSPSWVKLKIVKELDAVVAGWTAPRRSRQYFGALVLGLYDKNELVFIGSAGTGFTEASQKSVLQKLQTLHTDRSLFRQVPKLREKVDWVRPEIVARIKYGNWTDDRHLRAPVFLSLRNDATAKSCTFASETPMENIPAETDPPPKSRAKKNGKSQKAGSLDALATELSNGKSEELKVEVDGRSLKFTNLNKIYFPESAIRKRDLLAYYAQMADYILPFLEGRPLVLRRYPNGIDGKAFFQKEAPKGIPDWIDEATVYSDERGGEMKYVMANDRASLLFMTNLGCIDHNPWSSRADNQPTPDYVFFDLDPTPETSFKTVLRVARSIYKVLRRARMKCYLKTSGATGFHIFVPLESRYTYDQTRMFAQIVGQMVSAELPNDTTVERIVHKRPNGRVLLDALQNARGKPLACAYSVRAHAGATVSAPITAEELAHDFDPGAWNIKTMPARVNKIGDLWGDFWRHRQTLESALKALTP
jgi:bifunctional non-homologous end joining protein LigD